MNLVVRKNYVNTSMGLEENGYNVYVQIEDKECEYWFPNPLTSINDYDLRDISECFDLIETKNQMDKLKELWDELDWTEIENSNPVFKNQ